MSPGWVLDEAVLAAERRRAYAEGYAEGYKACKAARAAWKSSAAARPGQPEHLAEEHRAELLPSVVDRHASASSSSRSSRSSR